MMDAMLAERRRLEVLRRYAILDTPPDEVFERVAWLAETHFRVPISVVTFIDERRQWFKAVRGLPIRETPREIAFCNEAIRRDGVFVVHDASTAADFRDNPLVVGEPHIRFYAGAPLITPNGTRLGTVAVIDTEPRKTFGRNDRQFLMYLSELVVHELEMRLAAGNVMAEIEERRRIARELQDTAERFRLAITHSPVALFTQDLDLRYTWAANTPVPAERLIGLSDAEVFPPEVAAELDALKREVLETQRPVRREIAVNSGGMTRIFDVAAEPLKGHGDSLRGLAGAAIDVTAEHKVKDELRRALAAKSQFFAAAGHDLRQPFQAMSLFYDVLWNSVTDERQRAALAGLGKAMTAGKQLLTMLLDVSTLEAGTIVPRPEPVPISCVLDDLAEEFGPQAAERNLRFSYVRSSAVVVTEAVLLGRMIRNLLSNAIKYTECGGILLGCRRHANGVSVEVWDTGIGIPADKLSEVFDDFVQLDNPERDRSKGLGLGLAVVARMGRLLHHPVRVRSTPQRGTAFLVTVPTAQP